MRVVVLALLLTIGILTFQGRQGGQSAFSAEGNLSFEFLPQDPNPTEWQSFFCAQWQTTWSIGYETTNENHQLITILVHLGWPESKFSSYFDMNTVAAGSYLVRGYGDGTYQTILQVLDINYDNHTMLLPHPMLGHKDCNVPGIRSSYNQKELLFLLKKSGNY